MKILVIARTCLCLFLVAGVLVAQGGRGAAGQAQAPPPATDCAASGTVVNGVTGEPIAKAMVSMGGTADGAGSATDSQGRWSMTNVTCGTRFVTATRIGFIPGNNLQSGPMARPRVQLASGSPATNIKVTLMPEASVTGRVLDADGDPVEFVQIRLMRVTVQNGIRELNQGGGTTADTQGNFRIGGLTPGRYVVCAGTRQVAYPVGGGPGMVFPENCFPGPPASGPAIAMPIEAGREVRTAFTLTPIRGAHVRGHVSGMPSGTSNGVPQVQLVEGSGNFIGRSAQVTPDGTFDIATVPPGSYTARASLPLNRGTGSVSPAQAAVEVRDSDVNNVNLIMQPVGSLSGTVRFALSSPAGAANPVVEVNLGPAGSGANFAGPIPLVHWDADHLNFDFANVPMAQLRFSAYSNDPAVYIRSATLRGQDLLNEPVTVNGTTGPIDVLVSDDTGGISVTVNDKDGNPVAAGIIMVPAIGMRRFLNSGDDGQASQQNLPVGVYRAWAFGDINNVPYAEGEWMSQNAGPGETVTVTSGGTTNVTLKRIVTPPE